MNKFCSLLTTSSTLLFAVGTRAAPPPTKELKLKRGIHIGKRWALLLLVALLGVVMAKQTTAAPKAVKDLKVGVSMYTLGAPYFAAQADSIKKHGEELGLNVIVTNANDDMTKQLNDVQDLLAQKIDLLLLNPLDRKGLIPATKAATKAGVPVVIFDSSIDPAADFVTTVQSNNTRNGELVGEWLASHVPGAIHMALISGAKGNPVGQARRDGVFMGIIEQQLRTNGTAGFTIEGQGWGNWAPEGGLNAMQDLLTAHPSVNVLLAENDSMALGAMQAIKARGKEGKILVCAAADGQKEAIALIKQGKYGATGMNDPALVGQTALDAGLKYLNGQKDFLKVTYTPPIAITQENADQYYHPAAIF